MTELESVNLRNGIKALFYRKKGKEEITDYVCNIRTKGENDFRHREQCAAMGLTELAWSIWGAHIKNMYSTFCDCTLEEGHFTSGHNSNGDVCDRYYYRREIYRANFHYRFSKKQGEWENFASATMPSQILEEIQFAESLKIFKDLELWSANDSTLVIGVSYDSQEFLICRWGYGTSPYNIACWTDALPERLRSGELLLEWWRSLKKGVDLDEETNNDLQELRKLQLEPARLMTFDEIKYILLKTKVHWRLGPLAPKPKTVQEFVNRMQSVYPSAEIAYEDKTFFRRCGLCFSILHKVSVRYKFGTHWHGLICDNEKCGNQSKQDCHCK